MNNDVLPTDLPAYSPIEIIDTGSTYDSGIPRKGP
jgi:hypothetical protein